MMNKNIKSKFNVLILIVLTICFGMTLQTKKNTACPTPLIFESINGFKLPVNDIAQLLTNQYSHNNLSNIVAPNKVNLTNIVYQSRLLSSDQSQFYPTPLSAMIFNDKVQFEVDYKLVINQGTFSKNKTFVAKTKISNIDYVLQSSSFLIKNVTLKLDGSMFTTTFDQQLNQKQTDSFNTAIKGNTSSLFATFTKLLAVQDLTRYMQSNTKKQPLSVVYKENPYNYKFDDGRGVTITIPIDITTTWYNATTQTQLTNGISGMLPSSNTYCSEFVPNFGQHGGQLFITKQLVQNFVQYNLMAFSGWQQIKIDKTTIRSTILQWQLLDLDYVVDNLWTDLYMVSQNQIYFTCTAKQNIATKFIDMKGPKLHQTLQWSCNGFVKLNQTTQQKVIQFYPTIDHITELSIYQGSILPLVNSLQLIDCQFKDVPSMNGQTVYTVNQKNMKLIQKLIQSVFNDFRTYPVGQRFWVGETTSKVQIEDQGRGIWVL